MSAPYVQTFTPVIGSLACNANCPYCCSRLTCKYGLGEKPPAVDWKTFDIAAQIARERWCVTAFITSKGEPTLYPEMVCEFVDRLKSVHKFPMIELQTNGIRLEWLYKNRWLQEWWRKGLNLVCISTVHWDRKRNQEIYGEKYPELKDMIFCCINAGLRVRVSCIMLKGFIDDIEGVVRLRDECTKYGADQLVVRPVSLPAKCCEEKEEWRMDWIESHIPLEIDQEGIFNYLEEYSSAKRNLAHGAKVYSILLHRGYPEVNICLSNCFTPPTKDEEIRQIIWLPNGRITDNWDHEGLIIL